MAAASPATLLVVDDQPLNIHALHEIFSADYRVLMATSGAQALQLCLSHQPDLVLLDVVMPVMDGHEVCRRLKSDARTHDIPVIFVTAQEEAEQQAQGLALGAADFIVKPVNQAVVRARVCTQLSFAQATRDLRVLNETLESRILERTAELELARVQADAASQAKTQFLSNMSHEIRTPMNSVIGMAWLALKSGPDPAMRNYLQKIHDSGQHLLGIINDILDFSKIEAGKLHLDEQDFDLAAVLANVASQTVHAAQAKGLSLTFDMAPGLTPMLHGDALRLGQIMLNYVSNAIKFTPVGSIAVRAAMDEAVAGGCLLRVEVQDSGIGLTPGQAAGLFQPFHQADASTTRTSGGTGLGLAICRQLASLMGGEAGVSSMPGAGSTFWFTARLAWGASLLPQARQPDSGGVVLSAAQLDAIRGARILVVEDNPFNTEVALGFLELAGVQAATAVNGKDAVELMRLQPFDCVLMDMQMPVMDGLQATRLIRADRTLASIPVIAMTANVAGHDRLRCMEAGMNDFLTKPIVPGRLYAALLHWLPAAGAGLATATERAARADGPAHGGVAQAEPAAPTGQVPDVNLSVLWRAVGGDPARFRRYASLFAGSIPEAIDEFRCALKDRNLGALRAVAHRFKPGCAMTGANALAVLCASLEALADGCAEDRVARLVAQIVLKLSEAAADIRVALDELPTPEPQPAA